MSALAQAALISGGIFVVIMARGYGRRAFDRGAVLLPLLSIVGFGYAYLHNAPVGTHELAAYAVAVALGLAFGGAATLVTRMERGPDGRAYTVTGPAFAGIWAAAVVLRLAFIWAVTNWAWAQDRFGEFMITHRISFDAIAPFFLLWALTMVVSRVVALKVREGALVAPTTESAVKVAA